MKETKTKNKRKLVYYLVLMASVLLLAAATVLTVVFVSGRDNSLKRPGNDPVVTPGDTEKPDDSTPPDDKPGEPTPPDDKDKPTGGNTEVKYVAPMAEAVYTLAYNEIYTNETLGWSYRHKALDFLADAGTEVFAMADGEVETVSYNDKTGNYIVVDHGNGLKSTYRFVEPIKGLGKGSTVKRGDVIGTVAEAYGSEYKDGTHLHFEVSLNAKSVNPTDYFDAVLSEK